MPSRSGAATRRLALCAVPALAAACGDNLAAAPDAGPPGPGSDAAATCDESRLVETLGALPDVESVRELACGDVVAQPAHCFAIQLEQPIQHGDPAGPRFPQHLWLVHRGCDRPTLVADWGYANDAFFDDELALLYGANALWIEHRFQGASVPEPGRWDWSALTIENGARDMHRIVGAFRGHYGGRWVSTGESKGGMTAAYHAYFFPGDLDGTIAYVAPASRERVDPQYQAYLASALPEPCAGRVRDVQVAALTTRRDRMLQRLGAIFGDQAPLYLDIIISTFDWGFWQRLGAPACGDVPTAASSDDELFEFVARVAGLPSSVQTLPGQSPPGQSPPGQSPPGPSIFLSDGALYYEWLTEHGYAQQIGAHVEPLLVEPGAKATMEDAFRALFPDVPVPAFRGDVTAGVRRWVREDAEDLLLVYGEYDPWSGGALDAPARASSGQFFVPAAAHDVSILDLAGADRAAALAHATRMFGRPPAASIAPAARRAAELRREIVEAHAHRAALAGLRLRIARALAP